ncbi:MAG: hypothetical protein ACRECH_09110 [Nitrososphaerales archaeon]
MSCIDFEPQLSQEAQQKLIIAGAHPASIQPSAVKQLLNPVLCLQTIQTTLEVVVSGSGPISGVIVALTRPDRRIIRKATDATGSVTFSPDDLVATTFGSVAFLLPENYTVAFSNLPSGRTVSGVVATGGVSIL